MKSPLNHAILPVLALSVLAVFLVTVSAYADPVRDKYYARLAKVSPRDAIGFFELARWCEENNLAAQGRQALERTIRIDPDHAAARKALGYRRYGLGWRLAKDIPKPTRGAGKKSSGRSSKVGGTGGRDSDDSSDGDSPGEDGTSTSEVGVQDLSVEERLAQKRAWAVEAAKKSGLDLNTIEEKRGFLIHSTRNASSTDVKKLKERLKDIRKNVVKAVGLRGSADIWPHKIQIFFLRKLECARFADTVLGRPFPQNARWEKIDEYRLLVAEISDLDLTRFLATTALRYQDGKERWIPSWIEAGTAHAAAALTQEGRDLAMHKQAYLTAQSQLENTPDRSPLIEMLELTDVRSRNADRNRKIALTLLDFLKTARKRRFLKFVDEATAGFRPPKNVQSTEFKDFYIDYFQRQEKLFKSIYRMDLSELDEKWQVFVFERAKKIDEDDGKGSGARKSRR
jgi:hypothetical protein